MLSTTLEPEVIGRIIRCDAEFVHYYTIRSLRLEDG